VPLICKMIHQISSDLQDELSTHDALWCLPTGVCLRHRIEVIHHRLHNDLVKSDAIRITQPVIILQFYYPVDIVRRLASKHPDLFRSRQVLRSFVIVGQSAFAQPLESMAKLQIFWSVFLWNRRNVEPVSSVTYDMLIKKTSVPKSQYTGSVPNSLPFMATYTFNDSALASQETNRLAGGSVLHESLQVLTSSCDCLSS